MLSKYFTIFGIALAGLHSTNAHENWEPTKHPAVKAHAPSPLPDRVTLTWEGNPATTQSVTWRTDTTVKKALAQISVANANGRALQPFTIEAKTTIFQSGAYNSNYHSVMFEDLNPNTLYAYRVGDGANWTEFYHFQTASKKAEPFSFIYFGDAQNEVRTHWSRVFREAFRDAPRAAFTLHAGDLVDEHDNDAQWGEWHQGPDWVNGTVPVIVTPGNHEYRRINQGPESDRYWTTKQGKQIEVTLVSFEEQSSKGSISYSLNYEGPKKAEASMLINDGGQILSIDQGLTSITGFTETDLLGTSFYSKPLNDRQRVPGTPVISEHWQSQFALPVQNLPEQALHETVYFLDYQGVRFISLNSNEAIEAQVPWLINTLEKNPNNWTILTFHHPIFSPAADRDNQELRDLWKPIFDKFKVDLVLSGHDHTYARTGDINVDDLKNVPFGYQQAYDPEIGTVYVVSVSGPKMYQIGKGNYAKRTAEDTQLYQIIDINDRELKFRAYQATGLLYDEFTLRKRKGMPNLLIESSEVLIE